MQKNQVTKGAAPAPILFPGDEPFWEAAKNGQMLAPHAGSCTTTLGCTVRFVAVALQSGSLFPAGV